MTYVNVTTPNSTAMTIATKDNHDPHIPKIRVSLNLVIANDKLNGIKGTLPIEIRMNELR